MKKYLSLFLVLSIFISLTACSSEGIDPSKKAEITVFYELINWGSFGETSGIFNNAKEAFEKKYKNITITLEPITTQYLAAPMPYSQSLKERLATDEKADIIITTGWDDMDFLTDGSVIQMDNLVEKNEKYFENIYEKDFLDKAAIGGKIYALPLASQTIAMFYNKSILEKNGISLKPDWTWDDFYNYCSTISNGGAKLFSNDCRNNLWMMGAYANSNGLSYFNEKFDKANLTNPTFLKSVEFEKKLRQLDPYFSGTGSFSYNDLDLGLFAFNADIISLAIFNDLLPKAFPSIGVTNMPIGSSDGFNSSFYLYGSINKKSDVQKESFEFLKTLLSEEIQQKFTILTPLNKTIYENQLNEMSAESRKVFEDIIKNTRNYNETSKTRQAGDLINTSLNERFDNNQPIDEVYLKSLDDQLEAILN